MFVPVSRAIIKDEQAYVWEHDRRFTGPFLVSFSTNHVEISLFKSQLASLKKQCTL